MQPLSRELRVRTAAAHAQAERSPYLTALVGGTVTRAGLAALLGRLLPVYEALEQAGRLWADDPRVGPLLQPGLLRTAHLRADLVHLTGDEEGLRTPAVVAYAQRVEHASRTAAGFVAHHYTRSLADLSGGQAVRAALPPERGASFFGPPDEPAEVLRQRYRIGLDALPLHPAEREELVAEVLEAYRLNVALTRELDAHLPRWTSGGGTP